MSRRIGRYVLYEPVASGGMAVVHLGRMLGPVGFSRTVAIKRLHAHLATDPEFVTMFLDEARLAARIHHPNVVSTLDVVASDGELFLVMDYVLGDSLSQLLRLSRENGLAPPPNVLSAVMSGILYGLHAAHETRDERSELLGIVHRDVSPQNLLVGEDGVARVVDFGVAKAASRMQSTRDGQLKGKLSYMSPEQILRKPVDRRADVYAAGVVLWEALTGRKLFQADDVSGLAMAVLAGEVPRPSSRRTSPSSALDDVVLRALDRRPEARFATALDFASDLEAALPPAPPRKVAEWVAAVAGERIEERRKLLSTMEQTPSDTLDEESPIEGLRDRPRTRDEALVLANTKTAKLGRLTGADSVENTHVSGVLIQVSPAAPAKRRLRAAAILGGLLFAIALVYALQLRRTPSQLPATMATPPVVSPTSSDDAVANVTPPQQTAVETARGPTILPASPSHHAMSRMPTTASTVPPLPRAAPSLSCDPAFTVDLQGVKRFKPWCL
jgi:serine/threonine protein kinase